MYDNPVIDPEKTGSMDSKISINNSDTSRNLKVL